MASVNYAKFKNASAGVAMMRHCDREERLLHEHKNTDIDKERTMENRQLRPESFEQSVARYRDRIAELDATTNTNKRRDRVTLFGLETTVPDGMDPYGFAKLFAMQIEKEYGKRNVIQVYLHVDEIHDYLDHGEWKTSKAHVHAYVVPEIDGKLNGKQFSSRERMQALNRRIDEKVRSLGFQFHTGESPRHQRVEELKAQSKREELELLDRSIGDRRAEVRDLSENIEDMERTRDDLSAQNASLSDSVERSSKTLAEQEKMAQRASQRAKEAQEIAEQARQMAERDLQRIEREAQERPATKRKLGGREVVEVEPETYARMQDAAARVREADKIVTERDSIIREAKQQASGIVREAEQRAQGINASSARVQLEQIRKEWPEINKCFARNGVYQSRSWGERDHTIERSRNRGLER